MAKGRVWSGEDARKNGLVDELGGYDGGVAAGQGEAANPPDEKFELAVFPRPKSAIERIVDRIAGDDGDPDTPSSVQIVASGSPH